MAKSHLASLGVVCACAGNPATGVGSNGGPLRVQYSTGTGTYVSNDVVGTYVHRDADGNEIGTTQHVEARAHSYEWNEWKYFQGHDELDEQDYYRIAGDPEAVAMVGDARDSASRKQAIGLPLMIVGYAAVLVFANLGKQMDDPQIAQLGALGGSVVGTVGGLVWYWGRSQMHDRHHLPMSRADRNAEVIEECREHSCTAQPGGRSGAGQTTGEANR